MRLIPIVIAMALVWCVNAFGQQKEISEADFRALEARAQSLRNATSYRFTVTREQFENKAKPGKITYVRIWEQQLPDQWREVEEKTTGQIVEREERIWDGNYLYEKSNNGPWKKYNGGGSGGADIETGQITTNYYYIGKETAYDRETDRYEVQRTRTMRKPGKPDAVVEVRKTIAWFLADGKLIKKQIETEIQNRNELSKETTVYEYEPKDLKIVAPIK